MKRTTIALLLLLSFALPLTAVLGAEEDAALNDLAACVQNKRHLLVALVMDQSGSLQETDPRGDRIVAATTAVSRLAEIAESASNDTEQPKVEVMLSGFDDTFDPLNNPGWVDLDASTLPSTLDRVASYAEKDSGIDTDFYAAFDGARKALAARANALSAESDGVSPCEVLLLFTDGEYSIDVRSNANERKPYAPDVPLNSEEGVQRAVSAGQRAVCRGGGVADQIRSLGVIPVVVSLNATGFDQGFIRSVATGKGCGEAGAKRPGVFLSTNELGNLIRTFDSVAAQIGGGTPIPEGPGDTVTVCARKACPRGSRSFAIDDSLSRFHILVQLGAENIETELRSPRGGKPLVIRDGAAAKDSLNGIPVTVSSLSSNVFSIDAEKPTSTLNWTGKWTVTFIDRDGRNPNALVDSQIVLYGDLVPLFDKGLTFQSGEENDFEVEIASKQGQPTPPQGFVQKADLRVVVTDPVDGSRETVSMQEREGRFVGTYTPREQSAAPSLNVTATLGIVSSSGVSLVPTRTTISVPVLPPAEFPRFEEGEIRLSTLEAKGDTQKEALITVIGPERGSGCVWFDPEPQFSTLPPETDALSFSVTPAALDEASCVEVGAGQQETIRLRFHRGERAGGVGEVEASLVAHLTSDESADQRRQVLTATFGMSPGPIQLTQAIGILAGLMAGGVLLPLALLWASNSRTARFEPPSELRGAVVNVEVDSTGGITRVVNDETKAPLSFGNEDFENVGGEGGRVRSFQWRGFLFGSKAPLNPFAQPWGEVQGSDCVAVAGLVKDQTGVRGKLDLALAATWSFALDHVEAAAEDARQPAYPIRGRFCCFVAEGVPTADQAIRITSDAANRLPELALEAAVHRLSLEPTSPTTTQAEEYPDAGSPEPPTSDDDDIRTLDF